MQESVIFSLVIFDCDGVLVDSEMLSASVLMRMMADVGLPITAEIFREDFLGRSFATAAKRAEARFGCNLPGDFQLRYRRELLARMEHHLKPMAGVEEVLRSLAVPMCLATSSSPERLEMSMRVTGLAPWFEGKSYTASQVTNGKPAPDLCLHAASAMGCEPSTCLVIEDSEMGILAAQAAGMRVWHFAGGAHMKSGNHLPDHVVPDRVVHSMPDLLHALQECGMCRA